MANAEDIKKEVMTYLDDQGVKYTDVSTDDNQSITVAWQLENVNVTFQVFFDADGQSLHLGAPLSVKVPEAKLPQALEAVNAANRKYRWICFSVAANEETIVGEMDAVVEPSTAGSTVRALLAHACAVFDGAYPEIMHDLYE